jgi:2-polyprenyl-6-methoxyphenol hydroxylase-like FAD-dependent oxidoreductase
MNTLIIGAGVAGLTLNAYLSRRGFTPDIVERASTTHHTGYSLGLFPLGSNVLHGLGVHDKFMKISQPVRHYRYGNGKGELVHTYDFEDFTRAHGPYQMIGRGELLTLLLEAGNEPEIQFQTTVQSIEQTNHRTLVKFSNGVEKEYDLVVACDGMNSQVRKMVFEEGANSYKTGWGGWMWWMDSDLPDHDTVTEYWCVGRFMGVYPAKSRVACFVGGPNDEMKAEGNVEVARHIQEKFRSLEGPAAAVLESLSHQEKPFYWDLLDVRADLWHKGRVVLVGDSGGGFLPTAGVGASMAMESAAVLHDILLRTGPEFVPKALEKFQKRRQPRVFKAQNTSRTLAKIMTVKKAPLAWGRDYLMKFCTVEDLLKDISEMMNSPA